MNAQIKELTEQSLEFAQVLEQIHTQMSRIIVGQDEIIEKILISLIAKGNVLLEGVPGLAKTLMVKTLSESLKADFARLQFTPDLLPADITGTKIYDHKKGTFETMKGPIFTNFVLADEINRAPPKVQSALLEAMQEGQVSIQGDTMMLPKPFMVLATQNSIESEGTYNLPEAQVDRFMFKLLLQYPTKEDELKILERFTQGESHSITQKVSLQKIKEIQDFVPKIYADEKIMEYVTSIIDATRHPKEYKLNCADYIEFGASPRASLWLIIGAKAHALLNERGYVKPEDIKAVAKDVLRHRIILTYEAEAEKITSDHIIDKIFDIIKVP